MFEDIINNEKELLATLETIKDLINEHNIFPLKGMMDQIDKLIERSNLTIAGLNKIQSKENNNEHTR
tara:strand:+ start:12970 stop:13170 length:201 start_codon:yes stop_codon:yes gene_type:complete